MTLQTTGRNFPSGILRSLLIAFCLLLYAAPSGAQTAGYFGRAVGEVVQGEGSQPGTSAFAGGETDESVFCDETVDCCFDQPSGCGGAPTAESRTRGGAGPSVDATFGFPRVDSRVGAISLGMGANILSLSGVQAIADSDGDADGDGVQDGGLVSTCGVATIIVDEQISQVILEDGLNIEIPQFGVLAGCVKTPLVKDGRSTIEVDVTIFDPAGEQPDFLRANALAGVELPFTTGGACAISRNATADPGILGTLGLLWVIARRRRKHR